MVEAFAVASGKGGTGKTTTLALGMALAADHDLTVIDTDTGMANLLFHAGLDDVEVTLHDLLVEEAVYDRFGMSVVPCGTSLTAFEEADPTRLKDVVADLAARTRSAAPDRHTAAGETGEEQSAVEAFLADDERIQAIREQARAEAEQRAEEWGLEDHLDG